MNENGQSEFSVMPNQSVASVTKVSPKNILKKKAFVAVFGDEHIFNDSERFSATATVATQCSSAMMEPIYQKNPGRVIV